MDHQCSCSIKWQIRCHFLYPDGANLQFAPTMPQERSGWPDGCWEGLCATIQQRGSRDRYRAALSEGGQSANQRIQPRNSTGSRFPSKRQDRQVGSACQFLASTSTVSPFHPRR